MSLYQYVYENGQWFWQSPGITVLLALLEGAAFLWFLRPLEERSRRRSVRLGLVLAFFGLDLLIQFQYFPVSRHCLAFLALWAAYGFVTRAESWRNVLFVTGVFCLVYELSKLLVKDGLAAEAIASLWPELPSGIYNSVLLVLYLGCLWLGVWFVRRHIMHYDQLDITGAQVSGVILPLVLYLFVRNLQFAYMGGDDYLWQQLQLVQIATAGCALVIILTTENALAVARERNEHLKMEMLLRSQQQQYLVHKEAADAVNRKYHDLKHYLTGIEALSRGEGTGMPSQVAGYVQAIRREIEPYECAQKTGSEVLDTLLNERIKECQEKGIRLVPYVDGRQLGFINPLDLCVLFGNAMDNAVEAAERVEEPALREISVKIGVSDKMLILRFQNYFSGSVKQKGSRLLTQKENSSDHGYGLENIRRLAEKYGGTAAYEISGKEFALHVVLPLPEQEPEKE